jgi:hypothetical protein
MLSVLYSFLLDRNYTGIKSIVMMIMDVLVRGRFDLHFFLVIHGKQEDRNMK